MPPPAAADNEPERKGEGKQEKQRLPPVCPEIGQNTQPDLPAGEEKNARCCGCDRAQQNGPRRSILRDAGPCAAPWSRQIHGLLHGGVDGLGGGHQADDRQQRGPFAPRQLKIRRKNQPISGRHHMDAEIPLMPYTEPNAPPGINKTA